MTECEAMRVDKFEIQRVLLGEPEFSHMFVAHILARNARVEEDLVDQLFNSTEKRLARVLLLLANFGKEGRTEPILAKISQETLAEMIGTTRSRVSHFMNKFRQLGFIDYNGHLEVHNSLVGVLLTDQPRTVSAPKSDAVRGPARYEIAAAKIETRCFPRRNFGSGPSLRNCPPVPKTPWLNTWAARLPRKKPSNPSAKPACPRVLQTVRLRMRPINPQDHGK